jgi:prepilin-type N-terminal cleavage/methylation domain-containing protein
MVTRQKRLGFTLVEMLVVITIIGVLVGLMIPAINSARESARRLQCVSQQQNIGKAILSYQTAKQFLPPVLNRIRPTDINSPITTWVMSIFGDLGRTDLLDYWRSGVTPDKQAATVTELICPSNRQMEKIGGLSYMVNMGIFKVTSTSNPLADMSVRLFRNRATVSAGMGPNPEVNFSFSSLRNSAQTVMLSESNDAGPWTFVPAAFGPPGGSITKEWPYDELTLSKLAFAWPLNSVGSSTLPSDELLSTTPSPGLSSFHRGTVVVTFCDGHTTTPKIDTACYNDLDAPLCGTP